MGRDYSHDPAGKERVRLTRAQSREVDRVAIEQFGIPGIVLMENAARGAADVACDMLGLPNRAVPFRANLPMTANAVAGGPDVLIVCGGGNNGGDGLAVARHLHLRGCRVRIALTVEPTRYEGDALINWTIVQAMALGHAPFSPASVGMPDLIIDAIFGTGLSRPPRDPFRQTAESINSAGRPVLAIDVPSGLDSDTGRPLGPACIRATRTVTFFAEKAGFANPQAAEYLGEVTVADIGCPVDVTLTPADPAPRSA